MAKRLKVYGGCFDGETEWIVATTSQAVAAAAFGISVYAFNQYGGEGSNDPEEAMARREPGQVFSSPYSAGGPRKIWVRGRHRYSRNKPWPPEGAVVVESKE